MGADICETECLRYRNCKFAMSLQPFIGQPLSSSSPLCPLSFPRTTFPKALLSLLTLFQKQMIFASAAFITKVQILLVDCNFGVAFEFELDVLQSVALLATFVIHICYLVTSFEHFKTASNISREFQRTRAWNLTSCHLDYASYMIHAALFAIVLAALHWWKSPEIYVLHSIDSFSHFLIWVQWSYQFKLPGVDCTVWKVQGQR